MKIGIDTFGCSHSRSGFGSYISNFISNLKVYENIEFEVFGFEEDRYNYSNENSFSYNSVSINDELKTERKWHKNKIQKFIKKNNYDVVIYPAVKNVLPPKFKNHIGIAIINSIISIDLLEEKKSYKKFLLKALKKIQKIVASSQFIKDDLVELGIDKNKIFVVYNGINHKTFFPTINFDEEFVDIKPFAIKKPYFIYGSSLTSCEKKHIELINAFNIFKQKTSLPHKLVLSGYENEYSKKIRDFAINSKFASDIFITGYFPHEDFAKLYQNAECCIFPSDNEGVGLPIIEAMACGIPVICSDKGALKEIGKTSALYINSNNIDEITLSMEKIITDTKLREKMIFDGIEWANNFNWEKTVEEVIKIIL